MSAPDVVAAKLAASRERSIPSFCKACGRDVHDFLAPDAEWAAVAPMIPHAGEGAPVLCYDCFCERLEAVGLFQEGVWVLSRPAPAARCAHPAARSCEGCAHLDGARCIFPDPAARALAGEAQKEGTNG
jgi:hypothetical protein